MSDPVRGGPLAGRVALVTGANHGIGAATAVALAELGADVAVSYLRLSDIDDDQPAAYAEHRSRHGDHTLAGIAAAGRRGHATEADLSDPETPARLIEEVEGVLGPVEILVNNASGWRKDTFASRRRRAASQRGDVRRPVPRGRPGQRPADRRIRRPAPPARGPRGGGSSSLTSGGPMGFPGEVSYGAAKAALENYTMAAATELAADGITANVVHPPVTDTGWVTDDVRRFVEQSPDLVHVATPDDVAEVIVWLCTDAAALVSGNILHLR